MEIAEYIDPGDELEDFEDDIHDKWFGSLADFDRLWYLRIRKQPPQTPSKALRSDRCSEGCPPIELEMAASGRLRRETYRGPQLATPKTI
ncbi:hypothetical protein BDW62DRAFT_194123 [Aspergillus aurantiobrunneus]